MKRLFILALAGLCLGGCAAVEPWEKETLASPQMQFKQLRHGEFFMIHSMITVEQAEGGDGKAGGGCGCR